MATRQILRAFWFLPHPLAWRAGKSSANDHPSQGPNPPSACQSLLDAADRDYMVRTHLRLVHRLCKRFVRSGELFDDLVQVGTIGLLKAIQKYDPNRGTVRWAQDFGQVAKIGSCS